MVTYARLEVFDIKYDTYEKKFFIFSKEDNRPTIGGFETASDAITFADKRVIKEDSKNNV